MKKPILTLSYLFAFVTAALAQVNTQRDTTFELRFPGLSGAFTYRVNEFLYTKSQPLSDGKIMMYGSIHNSLDSEISGIARLNADGSWDNTFDGPDFDQQYYIRVRAFKELNDGKYLVAGEFTDFSDGTNQTSIIRLNNNGSLDQTFNAGFNKSFNPIIWAMEVQPDGKILIAGDFTNTQHGNRIVRLNTDGSVDNTFKADAATNGIRDIKLLANGKILISGKFNISPWKNGVAVLNTDGSLDSAFSHNQPNNSSVANVYPRTAIQSNGKIVVAGFSQASSSRIEIVRYNADYTVDSTFHKATNTSSSGNYITDMAVQKDDKIIATGYFFKDYDGNTSISGIMRLNADGTVDTTFNTNKGFGSSSLVYDCAIQADGKILVTTENTTYQGESLRISAGGFTTNQSIIRLNGNAVAGPSGVQNKAIHNGFTFYPNPSSNQIFINQLQGQSTISIHNLSGQLIFKDKVVTPNTTIDVSGFANGIYILQVENDGGVTTQKLQIRN